MARRARAPPQSAGLVVLLLAVLAGGMCVRAQTTGLLLSQEAVLYTLGSQNTDMLPAVVADEDGMVTALYAATAILVPLFALCSSLFPRLPSFFPPPSFLTSSLLPSLLPRSFPPPFLPPSSLPPPSLLPLLPPPSLLRTSHFVLLPRGEFRSHILSPTTLTPPFPPPDTTFTPPTRPPHTPPNYPALPSDLGGTALSGSLPQTMSTLSKLQDLANHDFAHLFPPLPPNPPLPPPPPAPPLSPPPLLPLPPPLPSPPALSPLSPHPPPSVLPPPTAHLAVSAGWTGTGSLAV
ncbi:unnamed protein product [Closterium sp. Naga37s-1]|nr:unnamed protein product [Closterium sp. Naga37s-1]